VWDVWVARVDGVLVVLCGWYGEVIFVTDIFGWFADFVRVRSERFLDVIVCV
jgi:hypothetical protein